MMRLALPKGRNLAPAIEALRSTGLGLEGVGDDDRQLCRRYEEDDIEVLMLKDWDVPTYVQHGIADLGIVGTDVLKENDGDLLVPVLFREGGSRLSLIGPSPELPAPGSQVRLGTKYPNIARQVVSTRSWGAEIFKLQGSVELGPVLDLCEIALDIVQTGTTMRENGLVEVEVISPVNPCLIVNRASFQRFRGRINDLVRRLEEEGKVL